MPLQMIFLGAPGSGKGTQAKRMVSDLNFMHVSTGDLLREEIKLGSQLGQKVQGIINRGELVDDMTVLELLKKNCDVDSSSYVFDGFPRNIEQTKLLDQEILNAVNSKAVYFEINLNVLIDRIVQRRVCKNCGAIYNLKSHPPQVEKVCDLCGGEVEQRKDDNEETVKTRLKVFQEAIDPVLKHYEDTQRLVRISAEKSADEIFSELKDLTEK